MTSFAQALTAVLDRLTRWGGWLVLPLSLLLAAQWPLRDWVAAGSRQANDMAQWIFALYVAIALRHATRVRGHMAADALAARYAPARRRAIARWGQAICLLPWSLYVLVTAAAPVWQSLSALEAFPDTLNPLYFVVKASVWLLALLVAAQSLVDLLAPEDGG
jgi:TRAP-type mannitol/chloroaromatic compound transport system permease small subunit